MEDYHRIYNEQVVQNGEPFNKEALAYLDNDFKRDVTSALEACLDTRPDDPIRFLAEQLKSCPKQDRPHAPYQSPDAQSATSSRVGSQTADDVLRNEAQMRDFVLTYSGGVTCTIESAARAPAAPLSTEAASSRLAPATDVLPGFPVHRLFAPTVYELDAVLRNLDACAPVRADGQRTRTLVLVEPPTAPVDLFFLQGVPYYTDLASTLAQHQRRGNDSAPQPEPGQTHFALALSLLAKSLAARVSTLEAVLDSCDIRHASEEVLFKRGDTEAERIAVVLPAVQSNCLHTFDLIDAGVGLVMGDSPRAALAELPAVIFVTFNRDVDAANLTLARLLAAYLPHVEAQQRHGIASLRATGDATVRQLSYEYCLSYWDGVHERRDARDEARGIRRAGARRIGRGGTASGEPSSPASAQNQPSAQGRRDVKQEDSVSEELRRKLAQARETRRQDEDSAFLAVLHDLRDRAATTIQAHYRGWRARRSLSGAAVQHAARSEQRTVPVTAPKPADVPPLLWFTLCELQRVHGEIFGHYAEGCLPEPRVVRVHRPVRRSLPPACEGDVGSDADEWVTEEVLLPPTRLSEPLPHFNPLTRLLECHRLAGCHRLQDAASVQRQCSGMSLLLRRSYDQLRSLMLDLAHIAHVELVHRRCLGDQGVSAASTVSGEDTFSAYMEKHFAALLSASAHPHPLSRSVLGAATAACGPHSPAVAVRNVLGVIDDTVVNREQLLVLAAEDAGGASLGAQFKCIARGLYVLPPFLSEKRWGNEVASVRAHWSAQSTAAGVSSINRSPSPDPRPTTATQLFVDWWALSPLPVVYVTGLPFALVPRTNAQDVQGLVGYTSFVPSVVTPSERERARDDGTLARPGMDGLDAVVALGGVEPDNALRPEVRLTHFGQVVDGVMARLRSPKASSTGLSSLSPATPPLSPDSAGSRVADHPTLGALLCTTLAAEEKRFRRILVDRLALHGGLEYYSASGMRTTQSDAADENDQSVAPQWTFGSIGVPTVSPSRKALSAAALHRRFFEWIPTSDVNRSYDSNTSGARGGPGALAREGTLAAEQTISVSRDNSMTTRSGRRRSTHRGSDAFNRLRDSVMSSQRLSFAGSGHNSPHISTSISPSASPRTEAFVNGAPNSSNVRTPLRATSPSRATTVPSNSTNAWAVKTSDVPRPSSGRQDGRRLRRRQEQASEDVRSVEEVAGAVAARHLRDGVTLFYHRAWFLPMPFKGVLPRLEVFIEAALASLKARCALALSADVQDTMQGFMIGCTALLSLGLERVATSKLGVNAALPTAGATAANGNGEATSAAGTASRWPVGHRDDDDDGLRDEDDDDEHHKEPITVDHPKLLFLRAFLTALEAEVHRHGVRVEDAVARVQTVTTSLGLPLLPNILREVNAAEQEPREGPCRHHIIAAVQAAELYGLLVVFDTYLALPFVVAALATEVATPLPPLSACLASMSPVTAWLECIDPWADAPHRSPDPAHLRYSNWLRRWDDPHYICYGAL